MATANGFRLAVLMLTRGGLTIDEIAREWECTIYHAYKVVRKCELGAVIERGPDGRYRIVVPAKDFSW